MHKLLHGAASYFLEIIPSSMLYAQPYGAEDRTHPTVVGIALRTLLHLDRAADVFRPGWRRIDARRFVRAWPHTVHVECIHRSGSRCHRRHTLDSIHQPHLWLPFVNIGLAWGNLLLLEGLICPPTMVSTPMSLNNRIGNVILSIACPS